MGVIADRMAAMGTENAFKVGEDIARAEKRGVDVIRFTLGEPDFASPTHVNQAGIDSILAGNTHYADPQGIAPFRKAIADYVSRTRKLSIDPDRVVGLPGAKPGIGYSITTYVNPGDEVIYPSPGFPIYESWVTFVGAKPVPLHLRQENDFAFAPEELEALITPKTKLIILCSPSNPTGGVLSREVLEGVAEVIKEKARPDIRIYSDEIYEQITYDGFQHYSIASVPGMQERTVISSGHSKSFAMTGWRIGFVVLPTAEEARLFKQININIVSCVPPFIQEAAREAFENPKTDEVVAHMVSQFKERRNYMVPALNDISGISCIKPLGAFYLFPKVDGLCGELGIHDFFEKLPAKAKSMTSPSTLLMRFLIYNHGVGVVDRRSFGAIGSEGQHFVRFSIATDLDTLKRGIDRIRKASTDRDGFASFTKDREALGVES
jgi:aspartate/methionine/tyrosine aminotransferase